MQRKSNGGKYGDGYIEYFAKIIRLGRQKGGFFYKLKNQKEHTQNSRNPTEMELVK